VSSPRMHGLYELFSLNEKVTGHRSFPNFNTHGKFTKPKASTVGANLILDLSKRHSPNRAIITTKAERMLSGKGY